MRAAKLLNDVGDIDFVAIGLIVLATWLAIWCVRRALPWIAEHVPSRFRLYLLGAVPLIRLMMLVLAVYWIVPIVFNVTLQNFVIIAGAVGVAIGFAFKDYVSSLIAGIVAIIERPYRPGDWIRAGEDYGEVEYVGMRAIRLRTPSDDVVTVPHLRIWEKNVSNSNDGAKTLMCVTEFHLAPDHDAGRLRAALTDIALTSAYLDYDHPVLVILEEKPWGTLYKLKAYPFDMRDQFLFRSELIVRGKLALRDAGAREVALPAIAGEGGGGVGRRGLIVGFSRRSA